MSAPTHVFESAGLGLAPFRIVGVEERRGPITLRSDDGITTTAGAPGQPMGTCDYCGTGIAECWGIRSADGRTFIVGCDCVRKTGDAGLRRQMDPILRGRRREAREAADVRRSDAVRKALANDDVRDELTARPHPTIRHLTALDWAEWMMAHAGAKGRTSVAGMIRTLTPA